MLSKAVSRFVRISPYKLRLLVDGVRGKRLDQAFNWLYANRDRKTVVVYKILFSAWSNAKVKNPALGTFTDVYVSSAKVDQGPVFKYSVPCAQGRSSLKRKRMSHVEVSLDGVKK
jgi:large subunit ribosomal protein L22